LAYVIDIQTLQPQDAFDNAKYRWTNGDEQCPLSLAVAANGLADQCMQWIASTSWLGLVAG